MDWWHARTFDTGYLRCGPGITIWRAGDAVNLCWTSEANRIDEINVFATPSSDVSLRFDAFERAASDFLVGVISAMAARVRALQNGAQLSFDSGRVCRVSDTTQLPSRLCASGAQFQQERRLVIGGSAWVFEFLRT
jgi:hypothetical protein